MSIQLSKLKIYPNPGNSGNRVIDFGDVNSKELTAISLYDNLGRKALSLKRPESSIVELSMPAGFYLMRVPLRFLSDEGIIRIVK